MQWRQCSFLGEGFENMAENLAENFIAPLRKTNNQRYEQWKKANLFRVALETMPKQVNQNKVLDNLIRLNSERKHVLNLDKET
jgi:hypothetical protein